MTACPVCGKSASDQLWTIGPEEAARAFLSGEGDRPRYEALAACIRRLWRGGNCTIRQCQSCSFGFADPFVSGDVEFYALSSPRHGYPMDRWEYGETDRILSDLQINGGKVLEIGAGVGNFLRRVVPKHFEAQAVTAFEYNSRGLSALQAAGYRALGGDFRDVLGSGERFRVIFMFQVLEHLDNQEKTFKKLKDLLEPGGRLFLSVPNPERIRYNESSGSLRDMPPAHIGRWRPETFQFVAQAHGLKLEGCQRSTFSWSEFFAVDVGYYYLRKAQQHGTLAAFSRSLRDKPYGKLLMRSMGGIYGPMRLGTWLKHAPHLRDYGLTLFAHFRNPDQ